MRGQRRSTQSRYLGGASRGLVPTEHADDGALNLAILDDDWFKIRIRGLEPDLVSLAEERLEGGFAVGEQCDDAVAVARGRTAFDDDVIAVEDALIAHGFAFHTECERAAGCVAGIAIGTGTGGRRNTPEESIPFAVPVADGTPTHGMASMTPMPRLRSGFERACFSVLAFVMLFATVLCTFFAALVEFDHREEFMATVVGAVGAFSIMLFAVQKLTFYKRPGFWRETLCPFLIAVFTTLFGLCVTLLVVGWLRERVFVLTLAGTVFSSDDF